MSVVKELQQIEQSLPILNIDIAAKQKERLEFHRKKYDLLDNVISGNTTFVKSIEEFATRYEGIDAWIPHLINKEYDKKLEELHIDELFGAHMMGFRTEMLPGSTGFLKNTVNYLYSYGSNPLVSTWICGLFGAAASFVIDRNIGPGLYSGVVCGLSLGTAMSLFRVSYIEETRQNAQYLDNKVDELYKGKYLGKPEVDAPLVLWDN